MLYFRLVSVFLTIVISLIYFSQVALAQNTNIANEYKFEIESVSYLASVTFDGITYEVFKFSNALEGNSEYIVLQQNGLRETDGGKISKAIFSAETSNFIRNNPDLGNIFQKISFDISKAKERDPNIISKLITSLTDRIKEISINFFCKFGVCIGAKIDITINNWDDLNRNVLTLQSLSQNLQSNNILQNDVELFYKTSIALEHGLRNSGDSSLQSDADSLKTYDIEGKKNSLENLVSKEPDRIDTRIKNKKIQADKKFTQTKIALEELKTNLLDCIWNNCQNKETFKEDFETIKGNLKPIENEKFNYYIENLGKNIPTLNQNITADKRNYGFPDIVGYIVWYFK